MISWLERHNGVSWFFVLVIAVAIFLLSSISFEGVVVGESTANVLSIVYHIFAFFFLAFFLFMSIVKGKYKGFLILVILIALLYGVSDEIRQLFVPGRDASIVDVLYDGVGILFAFMVYFISLEWRKR